jgi:uncharacterized RDD family membrane protein YckC
MQTIRISTSQNIDIDYEVAGVGERILARLIDFGLFFLVYILGLIFYFSVLEATGSSAAEIVIIIIYALLFVFYDLICETFMNGQSIGKRIMKIKVVSLDGARPSFSQYLLRWLFRIVDFTLSFEVCGLLTVIISEKQQRVGDMVAGTTLIKTKPRTKIDNLIFTPQADSYEPVFLEASRLNDKDITIIYDVINNYLKTGNSVVVYNTAERIKTLLSVAPPTQMNSMQFLQTIIKDYSHLSAQADAL